MARKAPARDWGMIRILSSSLMNIPATDAAEVLVNLEPFDSYTAYWAGRMLFWVDPGFAKLVFEQMHRLALQPVAA